MWIHDAAPTFLLLVCSVFGTISITNLPQGLAMARFLGFAAVLGLTFLALDRIVDAAQTPDKGRENKKEDFADPVNKGGIPSQELPAPKPPAARELIGLLQVQIDMKDFQNPMTLKETLGLIWEKFLLRAKDPIDLPIFVDEAAFKAANDEAPDVYETQVKFPSHPKHMSLHTMLRIAISKIPDMDAELLFRKGMIIITTRDRASVPRLLKERITTSYDKVPLAEVLSDFGDQSGLSITLDHRIDRKSLPAISAIFHGDVTFGGALRIVTDMAGLKVVDMKSGLYVTSPDNARELEKELKITK